ncbi:hypothetical protein MSBR3_0342 [Methanosarcina barkeri 3]|uniref:Uncharacterized protein n=1 Tax=Methanosarcina barkeri 3 TaxID=1434107 RepID=A0A0E3WVD7_METBA|nr:hypothetical protein [Methanosarcina barkeri]AKB80920.1 hypothetical protein MSBR3_0342 [Methanosarcina barkeri 3]
MDSSHPFKIISETDDSDIDRYRTLSIVKYKTDSPFDFDEIIYKFSKNKLNITKEFGCVYTKPYGDHVSALFGKLGNKTLTGLLTDYEDNPVLRRYNLSNVILATMYVDHFPEDNKLTLLVFNGGKISKNLWHAPYNNLFNVLDLTPTKFSEKELRKLCINKYVDGLSEIRFDPASEEEFGNVKTAEYTSIRSKKLNPKAEKIKEIIENDEIKVNMFKSEIWATYENLDKSYPVAFTIDIDGKVTLEFPRISWSSLNDDYDIEEHYYSFARKIYDEIVSKEIYINEKDEDKSQKSLFDF